MLHVILAVLATQAHIDHTQGFRGLSIGEDPTSAYIGCSTDGIGPCDAIVGVTIGYRVAECNTDECYTYIIPKGAR